MAMDLTVTGLPDLRRPARLHGGLGGGDRHDDAADPRQPTDRPPPASRPGSSASAFQLTNFIRDVAEDLERGRVYLPEEDLDRFGRDPRGPGCAAARDGATAPAVRDLIAYEVGRARGALRRRGRRAHRCSRPASQACIRAAYLLYGGILDEVAAQGYDVFGRRAVVPNARRLAVAARALVTPAGTPVTVPGPGAPVPG